MMEGLVGMMVIMVMGGWDDGGLVGMMVIMVMGGWDDGGFGGDDGDYGDGWMG